MIRLIFKTHNYPILELNVDIQNRQAYTYTIYDGLAARIILHPKDRNYIGLEARLQYYMVDTRPLPELLERIKSHGFYVPNQQNLDVDLIEVVEE